MLKSEEKTSYWQTLLSDFTSPSLLGINKSILTQVSSSANYLENDIPLSIELQGKIYQCRQTHQVSIEAFLQGAWGYLLARYSGNHDVVFGVNLMSKKSESDPLNIIPVRIQYHASETVFTYLKRFQQQLIESKQYSQITLNEIQKLSDILAPSLLFNHIFIYTNQPIAYKPTYPLNIIATDDDRLSIKIIFDENQYSQTAIENLISHYHELLKSMITSTEQALIDLTFITPEERKKIVIDWNKTDEDFPQGKIICQLFEEQVEKTPDNIAIVYKDQHLTYSEFNQKINQLANYLQSHGVKPDMMIAISMVRSLDLLIGIYGILKAGAAYVPLDPTQPENRLAYMLEDCRAPFLITTSDFQNKFSHYQGKFILMDKDANKMKNDTQNPVAAKPSNLAYVIYTSGSTGNPKGVMIEHRSLFNFLYSSQVKFPLHQHDAYLFKANQTFDVSVMELFGWFFEGGRLVILEQGKEKEPKEVLTTITKYQVTHTHFVPSVLQMMLDSVSISDLIRLEGLKYLFVGGEAISKKLAAQIKELLEDKVHFINTYGPTETTVTVSEFNLQNNIDSVNTPIGKPLHNIKLYILDRHLHIVPIGVPGELHIGGIGLARGYLNRAELTAKKFIQNPFSDHPDSKLYKSGDLCRYLSDGNIEYIGRIDHQVKIRGYRIELGEIEACLHAHPAIKTVIVVVNEDQRGEKQLIAYYTLKSPNLKLSTHELHKYSMEKLPIYMVPAAFVEMNKFPLTHTGKIDRKALPKPTVSDKENYVPPSTQFEKIIAEIWEAEFETRISIKDTFFDLGGHSLSAARIISKITKATHKEITLSEFYASPTIEKLANVLNQKKEIQEVDIRKQKEFDPFTGIPLGIISHQFVFWMLYMINPKSKSTGITLVERKRMSGKLDSDALQFSLDTLLKKQELLTYHIPRFLPIQYQQKTYASSIHLKDISQLSKENQEAALSASLEESLPFHSWKKGVPLVEVWLFYLADNISELQICIPHMIADGTSIEILYKELSTYYLAYKESEVKKVNDISYAQFKDFIKHEHDSVNRTINRDISFWEDYLKNISYITLPKTVLEKYKPEQYNLTYIDFPQPLLDQLLSFCSKHKLTIIDCVCAAVTLSLSKYAQSNDKDHNKKIAFTFMKSLRENELYDHTIGIFLRVDLLKATINDQSNLLSIAQEIQESKFESEIYQSCPLYIKFAYLYKPYWANKPIFNFILTSMAKFITKIFPKLKLNEQIILAIGRLSVPRPKEQFVIFINVLNSFINKTAHSKQKLFGFELQKLDERLEDHLVNNVLDVTLSRLANENKPYIVINAMTTSSFREELGNDILKHLSFVLDYKRDASS